MKKAILFFFVFVGVIGVVLVMTSRKPKVEAAPMIPAPTQGSPVAVTTPVPPPVCDGFDIRADQHTGDKVVSAGFSGNADQVRQAALEEARHNTAELRLLWNSSPLAAGATINAEGDLDDGHGCLTVDARQKWYQLKGAMMSATVVNEPAPADGTNTGANGSGAFQASGVAEENGDNRMSTAVTYQNGKKVWILHRCGNVVTTPGVEIPSVPKQPPFGGKDASLSSRGQGGTDRGVVTGPGRNGGGGTADNTVPHSNPVTGCQGNCPGSQPPQPPPAEKPPQPGVNTGRV